MALEISERLSALPSGSRVLVRKAISGKMGTFEKWVTELAYARKIPVIFCIPETTDRGAVYKRDYEMVERADYVEAYFSADRIMEGGTAHVVEAALAREKAVYAWSLSPNGRIERVGELDRAR